MPWPLKTNAPRQLKDELAAFIETLRADFPPEYVHVFVGSSENTKETGVMVEIYSQIDPQPAHRYKEDSSGREVLEEYHRVAVDVRADEKAGGADTAEAVYEVIRSAVLASRGREALIPQGIYDLRELPEAPDYGDVEFERPLHLTCNCDKYLT